MFKSVPAKASSASAPVQVVFVHVGGGRVTQVGVLRRWFCYERLVLTAGAYGGCVTNGWCLRRAMGMKQDERCPCEGRRGASKGGGRGAERCLREAYSRDRLE